MLGRHQKCHCSSEFERRDYLVSRLKTIRDLNEYLPPRAMAKLDITQARLHAITGAVGRLLVLIAHSVTLKWLSIRSHLPITLPLARLAFGVKTSRCNAPAAREGAPGSLEEGAAAKDGETMSGDPKAPAATISHHPRLHRR